MEAHSLAGWGTALQMHTARTSFVVLCIVIVYSTLYPLIFVIRTRTSASRTS
jgi:hypothetical protein